MSKTKEEILETEVDKIPDFQSPHYFKDVYDGDASAIYNAMEEYAKQESMEFLKWINKTNVHFTELYNLYQQSKT